MKVEIEKGWKKELKEEFEKPYFKHLAKFVKNEYLTKRVYPSEENIFEAFNRCSFDNVKVVLLGQDPYHGDGQANGLCFSVKEGVRIPPSLINIYKELKNDLGLEISSNGNLEKWASQGVLLLNAILTVRANEPGSHQKKGWEEFTDAVIKKTSEKRTGIVYFLWGSYAQKKGSILDSTKNLILRSVHPSPLSVHRGFYGNRHFSQSNSYLKNQGQKAIEW